MKRFLTADIHIGKNTTNEDELFDVLYFMLDTAVDNKCTHFDILGDLLENRALLLFRLWPRVKQFFNDLTDTGMIVSVMAGNHDFYGTTKRTESNLRHVSLNDKVRIIDTIFQEDGVMWVPWLFPEESIPSGGKVILSHLAFNGFHLSKRKVEEHGLDALHTEIPIYTGHFHTAQVTGNIRYLGSCIHHTWNDANETKSGYILGKDFEITDAIELNSKFTNLIKVSFDDLTSLKLPPKCKITVTDSPKGDEDLIAKALTELGAVSVECIAKSDEVMEEKIEDGMNKGLSVDDAVEEQIDVHEMKEELLAFHQILNK